MTFALSRMRRLRWRRPDDLRFRQRKILQLLQHSCCKAQAKAVQGRSSARRSCSGPGRPGRCKSGMVGTWRKPDSGVSPICQLLWFT